MKNFFKQLWVQLKRDAIPVLIGAVIGYCIVSIAYNKGGRIGYIKGYGDCIDRALDTMNKIIQKQITNDTSTVTKLTIIAPDTISVILSRKTLRTQDK